MAACTTPMAAGEGRRRETPRVAKPHLRLEIPQKKMLLKSICQKTGIFGGNRHGIEALLLETGFPPAQSVGILCPMMIMKNLRNIVGQARPRVRRPPRRGE
eukprot:7696779-Pyramimonas_sp.AAC.1